MFSGIGIYYPDRTQTQRIGIVPVVEINLAPENFKAGKDSVLQRAIKIAEKVIKGIEVPY